MRRVNSSKGCTILADTAVVALPNGDATLDEDSDRRATAEEITREGDAMTTHSAIWPTKGIPGAGNGKSNSEVGSGSAIKKAAWKKVASV